jgi:hypothetical protein
LFENLPDLESKYGKLDKNNQVIDYEKKHQEYIEKKLNEFDKSEIKESHNSYNEYINDLFDIKDVDITKFLKPHEVKQTYIEYQRDPDSALLINQYLKRNIKEKIAQLLKQKYNLQDATSSDGIIIYQSNWGKYYNIVCKVTYLLRDFKYKDAFKFDWGDYEAFMTIKNNYNLEEKRNIVKKLAEYLFNIVQNDTTLKNIYIHNKNTQFIEFHNKEKFDNPLILILCALFSTIGEKSGFETRSSDLNWNADDDEFFNISFAVYTGRTAETYATEFKIDKIQNEIRTLLIEAKVFPFLTISHNRQGDGVIGSIFELSGLRGSELIDEDEKKELKSYYQLMTYLISKGS